MPNLKIPPPAIPPNIAHNPIPANFCLVLNVGSFTTLVYPMYPPATNPATTPTIINTVDQTNVPFSSVYMIG